jgi:predicted N-acetyltransferase YhbS
MELRLETKADEHEVENLTRESFWDVYRPGCSEHYVLHLLRKSAAFIPELDYVMCSSGKIVGSIVYSRMFYAGKSSAAGEGSYTENPDVVMFGPVCVAKEYQGQGIGSQLIRYTQEKAKSFGYKAVLITGNPAYYSRFGFRTAAEEYNVLLPGMSLNEDTSYFMGLELECGYLKTHAGVYMYDVSFEPPAHDTEEFDRHFPPKKKREPLSGDLSIENF